MLVCPRHVSPHTLRHAFITAALDAGVPLRGVQDAASHADPRTTMRYDRARTSLYRHATYIVAAFHRRSRPVNPPVETRRPGRTCGQAVQVQGHRGSD
jgi:site-specific recombinase XerC